jgi:16S rRNA (cytosine1402-N4)-methyltransferase
MAAHQSVLLTESLDLLNPKPGHIVVDCTLGAGGHSAAIVPRISPGGRLIGLDVDPEALALARERLEPLARDAAVQLDLIHANFRNLRSVLGKLGITQVDGILADLGVSSMQFDRPERGFSFRFDHPLDMRMDPSMPETAADLLQNRSEEEIADILYHLGEEHKSRRIARAIVQQRKTSPIATTGQLEELVRHALRVRGHRRIHPATKTFQALRLAVNQELDALTEFLATAPELLAPGGTLAVITFHSLEDRPVKQGFKALDVSGRFQQLVKFVGPSDAELEMNPRSRSAKVRAIRAELPGAGKP